MELSRIVRSVTRGMPALFRGGEPGYRAGDEQLALVLLGAPAEIELSSAQFDDSGELPAECAADRGGKSPHLRWGDVPEGTRSLALLVEDPDAPTPRPFLHWLLWNIDPTLTELQPGARFPIEGKNSMMKPGFTGAAPPRGDRPHRYHFQLFALDALLELKPGAGRAAVLGAMRGHVLGAGEIVGLYGR